jgi:hypothetical protein
MRKQSRLAFRLASLGFAVSAFLYAYLELTDYALLSPALGIVATILCPAYILGAYLFVDFNAHSGLMAAGWVFLGVVNSVIYVGVGRLVGGFLWKSD